MDKPNTRPTLAVARQKAENYCAYQERCHFEVESKLRDMGLHSEEISDVLLHLVHHNFLNEERFALAFAAGKHRVKNWGRKKIIYHLKAKRINDKLIQKAIQNIPDDDYNHTLQELIRKKDPLLKEKDPFKRSLKITRYLVQKGFEMDLVLSEVKKFYKS